MMFNISLKSRRESLLSEDCHLNYTEHNMNMGDHVPHFSKVRSKVLPQRGPAHLNVTEHNMDMGDDVLQLSEGQAESPYLARTSAPELPEHNMDMGDDISHLAKVRPKVLGEDEHARTSRSTNTDMDYCDLYQVKSRVTGKQGARLNATEHNIDIE